MDSDGSVLESESNRSLDEEGSETDTDNKDMDMVIEDEAYKDRNIDQHESPQNLQSCSTGSEAVGNSSCSEDLVADGKPWEICLFDVANS